MPMPASFQLSQSCLQDFVDCLRRFYYKHVLQLAWPAVESEPVLENERFMQQGNLFHRLVQQVLLGIPAEQLIKGIKDQALVGWWQSFLDQAAAQPGLPGLTGDARRYPEISLSVPLGKFTLVAKIDLLVILPDQRVIIYDWKTSRSKPQRSWLSGRLQTHVYPYLLAQIGGRFSSTGIAPLSHSSEPSLHPELVSMVYWFPAYPDQQVTFSYDARQFSEDQSYLLELASRIDRLGNNRQPESFPLTPDEKRCSFCIYRSLCDRGAQAGSSLEEYEVEESEMLDLDFDQIAEIEF